MDPGSSRPGRSRFGLCDRYVVTRIVALLANQIWPMSLWRIFSLRYHALRSVASLFPRDEDDCPVLDKVRNTILGEPYIVF
jgi:hypothetical protein